MKFEDYMGVHSDSYTGVENMKRLFDATANMLNDLSSKIVSLEKNVAGHERDLGKSMERIDELEKKLDFVMEHSIGEESPYVGEEDKSLKEIYNPE